MIAEPPKQIVQQNFGNVPSASTSSSSCLTNREYTAIETVSEFQNYISEEPHIVVGGVQDFVNVEPQIVVGEVQNYVNVEPQSLVGKAPNIDLKTLN